MRPPNEELLRRINIWQAARRFYDLECDRCGTKLEGVENDEKHVILKCPKCGNESEVPEIIISQEDFRNMKINTKFGDSLN